MPPVHTAEGDAFALTMIVVLFSAFAVVALILFTIFRNAARRNREVEELIEDTTREDGGKKAPVVPAGEPWEKDGDWWKKG